jgi:hypothetical protein
MYECTMPQYTITIDGFESGLTEQAVEQSVRESLACPEPTDVTVEQSDTEEENNTNENISIERREYVNIFADGELIVSVSEEHNEVLVYQNGTDRPVGKYSLSMLRDGMWARLE